MINENQNAYEEAEQMIYSGIRRRHFNEQMYMKVYI